MTVWKAGVGHVIATWHNCGYIISASTPPQFIVTQDQTVANTVLHGHYCKGLVAPLLKSSTVSSLWLDSVSADRSGLGVVGRMGVSMRSVWIGSWGTRGLWVWILDGYENVSLWKPNLTLLRDSHRHSIRWLLALSQLYDQAWRDSYDIWHLLFNIWSKSPAPCLREGVSRVRNTGVSRR